MENKENFAGVEVLTLTALELLASLKQQVSEEMWQCLLNRVSKTCPIELLYEEVEGKPSRSFEFDSQRTIIGFIIDETVWALETVPNPDKLNWNARMEWVKNQTLGGKPASIASIPQIHALSMNWNKVDQTVQLLQLFGVKVEAFQPGKYLTSTDGNNREGVYPRCIITEEGKLEMVGPRSKTSPNEDIVRLVRKV